MLYIAPNTSQISMANDLVIFSILCAIITLAIWLESNTQLKHIGAALLCIIITAIIANLGIIPTASDPADIYIGIFEYIAPASIFMLLLSVNLGQLKSVGKPMLLLFILGSLGTCTGVFIAHSFIGENYQAYAGPIAGMITGTYTGGSINFNAIALHYDMVHQGVLYTSIVAVDNILTAVWMIVTLLLPKLFQNKDQPAQIDNSKIDESYDRSSLSISSLSILITTTVSAMILSNWLAEKTHIPSILILTTLALILAQFKLFHELHASKIIGLFLVYLFLSVVGAFCDFTALSSAGEFAFTSLIYLTTVVFIHGMLIIGIGRLLKFDWYMICIASQANIGGSSSALAMAKSFERSDLLLAAVLTGAIGNAIGTYLGFMMVHI